MSNIQEHSDLITILIVDDRQENLLALEAVLGCPDYRLVRADSGEEALKYLMDNDCAVILMDVQMPRLDGIETAVLIRQRELSREIPIIFITAVFRDAEHIESGFKAGGLDYLSKPFDTDLLRLKVASLVTQYRYRKAARLSLEGERQKLKKREEAAEKEARLQREQYHALFMKAPIPIFITQGPEHRFEFANEAYQQISGARPIQGVGIRQAFPELDALGFSNLLDEVYCERRTFIGRGLLARYRNPGRPPRLVVFDMISHPWLDIEGNAVGVITFAPDVTEQTQARRKLQKLALELDSAIRVRDSFTSVASHELKTPLTSLRLQIEMGKMILSRAVLPPTGALKLSKLMGSIDHQVDRLISLVEGMLDSKQMTESKMEASFERMDLAILAREVVDDLRIDASSVGSHVTVRAEYPIWGEWDRLRIEQMLISLVANAIKYGAGKEVQVEVAKVGLKARLTVRDHGIGIAPENQKRIFKRFERAVSETNISGLGLGLYIAESIAIQHGGAIQVESELGKGATFTVDLPLHQTNAQAA